MHIRGRRFEITEPFHGLMDVNQTLSHLYSTHAIFRKTQIGIQFYCILQWK